MDKKNWVFVALALFMLILLIFAFLFETQIKRQISGWSNQLVGKTFSGSSTVLLYKPTQSPVRVSEGESKTDLFIAELEYNPANSKVTQLKAEKQQGPQLWPLPAQLPKESVSSSMFVYKIEVWNLKQEITYSGWVFGFKKIMRTDKGNLKLTVMVPYQSHSFVKVYLLDDKLIWTGKMD